MLSKILSRPIYFIRGLSPALKIDQTKYSTNKLISPLDLGLLPLLNGSSYNAEIKHLWNIFEENNYQLRLVGGAVRDLILNKKPVDLDFATEINPSEMINLFNRYNVPIISNKGEKFGSLSVKFNNTCCNVTSLRRDILSDGRYAEVEFIKDWAVDAKRRDFTMNAIYLDSNGMVYDYVDGYRDLLDRKIVFIGDSEARIKEDCLRILRYFRFYCLIATNPNGHSKELLNVIKKHVDSLARLSGQRIWKEFQKLLCGNHLVSVMKIFMNFGIHKYLGLPDNPNIIEFEKVCSRTGNLQPNPVTLLTALLHDEKDFHIIKQRLKLNSQEQSLAQFILHHRFNIYSGNPLKPYKDLLIDSTSRTSHVYELLKYRGDTETLKSLQDWSVPKFPVSAEVLFHRGIQKKHIVNKILQELKDYWKESNFTASEEELLNHVEKLQIANK